MVATGETVGLADGSLMTPVLLISISTFDLTTKGLSKSSKGSQ